MALKQDFHLYMGCLFLTPYFSSLYPNNCTWN